MELGSSVNILQLAQEFGCSKSNIENAIFWQAPKPNHPPPTQELPSLRATARTRKWMVGRLVSFWNGLFSGAIC